MSFLCIEDLHINLGEFYLRDVCFGLEKGDYMMIIGPTGAGKTILLESIVGFWKPDRGHIHIEGRNITHELPERRNIGIVYQDYALLPHFTVFENIAYGLKKKTPNDIENKVRDMAESLNIDHLLHRKPATLSGGEQQRVAVARALIVEPMLLLMDEPFSALDPQTRRETRRLLKRAIGKLNTTVIHISHDLNDAWSLANKVAIFKEGQLLQFGPVGEIFNRPRSPFIAQFVGATILNGKACKNGPGACVIDCGDFCLGCLDETTDGAEVQVALRPENVMVTKERPDTLPAARIIEGKLDDIVPEGRACYLQLMIGQTELPVLVTNNTMEQLNAAPGDTVYAVIRDAHVKVI
jgi:molybdate transport system ATP-binding protein